MADRRARPEVHAEVEHHTAIQGVPAGTAQSLPIVREPVHPQHRACSSLLVALVDPMAKGGRARRAATRANVEVRLTDYDTFMYETGLPLPAALDATSAYGGHLLP